MRDYVAIQQKFANWLEMKRTQGHNFNQQLISLKEFHNPNVENRLMEFAGLDDVGSNLDPRDFDPYYLPRDANYEILSKEQRSSWEASQPSQSTASSTTTTSVQPEKSKSKNITLERFYGQQQKS